MDGYRIAAAPHHVASLKGVIADEVRFESGLTRVTMGMQARCERLHVQRAARVLVTSRYSAERAQEFYGLAAAAHGGAGADRPGGVAASCCRTQLRAQFAVSRCCSSGRFYRRKRVDVLLRAAAALRGAHSRTAKSGSSATARARAQLRQLWRAS